MSLPPFLHLHGYAGLEGGHRTSFVVKVDLFFVYCFHLYSLQSRLQNGLTNPEHQLNLSLFQRTHLGLNHHIKIYSRLLVNIYSSGHFYNFLWPVWISNLYTKWAIYHTHSTHMGCLCLQHPLHKYPSKSLCQNDALRLIQTDLKMILLQPPLFRS